MKRFYIILILAFILTGCNVEPKIPPLGAVYQKEYIVGGERVIVGGERKSDEFGAIISNFSPEIKLEKWGDETYIRVWSDEAGDSFATTDGDKTIWYNEDKSKEYNFYPTTLENGTEAFEYEIILKEKPATNIISLKIESKGLKFYYQPPLDEEFNDPTCTPTDCQNRHRPENIVGSYAVYHESKSGDYTALSGKNYMTGMAFMIYRPQMEDSNGWKVWGELNIDIEKGIETVTIPQDFIDKAVYPIKHASGQTFGNEVAGTSHLNISNPFLVGSLFTSGADAEGATVSKLTLSAEWNVTPADIKGVIVLHGDLTIITNGVGDAIALPASQDWIDSSFSTPPTISASTDYILMAIQSTGSTNFFFYYTTGVSNQTHLDTTNNYTTPQDPGSVSHRSEQFSIYATYTPIGAPACFHTGGDWYINTECWIATSTTTSGIVYIGDGGQLYCIDGATISAEKRVIGNGGKFSIKSGCKWNLHNFQ